MFWLKWKKERKNQRTSMVFGVEFTIPKEADFRIIGEMRVFKRGCHIDESLVDFLSGKYVDHEMLCYVCICPSGKGSTGWLVKFSGERCVIDDKLFFSKTSGLARIKKFLYVWWRKIIEMPWLKW